MSKERLDRCCVSAVRRLTKKQVFVKTNGYHVPSVGRQAASTLTN